LSDDDEQLLSTEEASIYTYTAMTLRMVRRLAKITFSDIV
jgi:hypothetical protein